MLQKSVVILLVLAGCSQSNTTPSSNIRNGPQANCLNTLTVVRDHLVNTYLLESPSEYVRKLSDQQLADFNLTQQISDLKSLSMELRKILFEQREDSLEGLISALDKDTAIEAIDTRLFSQLKEKLDDWTQAIQLERAFRYVKTAAQVDSFTSSRNSVLWDQQRIDNFVAEDAFFDRYLVDINSRRGFIQSAAFSDFIDVDLRFIDDVDDDSILLDRLQEWIDDLGLDYESTQFADLVNEAVRNPNAIDEQTIEDILAVYLARNKEYFAQVGFTHNTLNYNSWLADILPDRNLSRQEALNRVNSILIGADEVDYPEYWIIALFYRDLFNQQIPN